MARTNINIKYQQSILAFLDILGFKDKVRNSVKCSETLRDLVDSLAICGKFSSGSKKSSTHGLVPMQSRFFSDHVVFFTKKSESNLSQLFFLIRFLQDRLWEKGHCVRGAITMGKMYWPEREKLITLGPALIKAVDLEQKVAIYPRIVLAYELFDYVVDKQIDAYPFGQNGKLKNFIRRDIDGVYFLDLLNSRIIRFRNEHFNEYEDNVFSIIWDGNNQSKYAEIFQKVREIVDENIHSKKVKARQKYEWLKSYLEKYLETET